MAFSLFGLFKKKAPQEEAPTPAPAPLEKPSSDRLRKTVRPSGQSAAPSSRDESSGPSLSAAASGGGMATQTAPAPVVPRTVSFGSSPAPAAPAPANNLPPAVAVALEPRVERAISIDVADVVAHMPEGYVRPLENRDVGRHILLKASELERGMSNGRPAVSIFSIYEQVPEIFVRSVASSNTTQVPLPFSKVLEQFSTLQTRSDQYRDLAVPHVETPFLKVTLEDDERFGTKTEILQTGDMLPVRLEPATAESIAAAEPEAMMRESVATAAPAKPAAFSLRAAAPAEPKVNATPASAPSPAAPAGPTRIPFKLTPNGAGVPAPEQVPASAEPPAPSLPTAAPARIPFKVSAPSDDLRRKPAEPWLTKENFAGSSEPEAANGSHPAGEAESQTGATISLPLGPIMRNLMQLVGDADQIASDARIELPFAVVEPQLVTGRVVLKSEEFAAALPEEYRSFFDATSAAPVSLPLQEVLKNLPATSLRMRDDQEEQEKGANFATPFSAKAEEDAKRFKTPAAPIAKPVVQAPVEPVAKAPEEPTVEAATPVADEPTPQAAAPAAPVLKMAPAPAPVKLTPSGERSALQKTFNTDDELDAKGVVNHVGKMEGVDGCAIMFGDGLSLAGNLPETYQADALCAVAPSLLQRMGNHMVDTKLGALTAMTLSCAQAAVTFFMHDNLCLAAVHRKAELAADVRERLSSAVQELSRIYSHPA